MILRPPVAVLGALVFSLFACGSPSDRDFIFETKLRVHRTTAWSDVYPMADHVLVYWRTPGDSSVYFAQRRINTIADSTYAYDLIRRTLRESAAPEVEPGVAWRLVREAGEIERSVGFDIRCQAGSREGIRINSASGCIVPEGRSLVAAMRSPAGRNWLVMSAEGEHEVLPRSVWGPGGSTLRALGQHFLQVVSEQTETWIGRPIPLGIETSGSTYCVDWIDEENIVIASGWGKWLAVVELGDFTFEEDSKQ